MSDRPKYYRVKKGRAYFELGRERAERAGMEPVTPLGIDGPRAKAEAYLLYAQWLEAAGKAEPTPEQPRHPKGSLGDWFLAYRKGAAWKRKSETTRAEWFAVWKYIDPVLGSRPLRDISPAEFEAFALAIEEDHGPVRRWRVVKIARALFNAAVNYRVLAASPCNTAPNPMPRGRSDIWLAAEIVALMDAAERIGRPAMRLAIWIAWETMFQPIDVRRLSLAQRHADASGAYFHARRAKTGAEAVAAITEPLSASIDAYIEALPVALPPDAPFLRTTTGHEYRKARFLDDFAKTRAAAFGKEETRRFQDIRRSANVEADIAGASPEDRAAVMANTLDKSDFLERTYTPETVAKSRKIAAMRQDGRKMLAQENIRRSRNRPSQSELLSEPRPVDSKT